MEQWQQRSGAYMQVQGTRPQTIGQSLADSPLLTADIRDFFRTLGH